MISSTVTDSEKLYNVAELLKTPSFLDCEFGTRCPDSLRLLNEDLMYAEGEEGITDALNSLNEARDALNKLIAASELEAVVFSSLCEEVQRLENEDKEQLSRSELDALIDRFAKELCRLRLERLAFRAEFSFFSEGEIGEELFKSSWDRMLSARAEVNSWFAFEEGDL